MEPYQELEQKIGEWAGYSPENVVACSSGTAALHLSLEALQLPQRSKVITSDFNMIAVPRAIVMAGLEPVFVDCDERLLMNRFGLGRWVGDEPTATVSDVGAIIIVHIYGRQCSVISVLDSCVRQNPYIIEDLAEAHGVKPCPETDAACWSFYHNKIVAGEEGGAVAFRDPKHASLARSLRSLGFTDKHDFQHIPRGMNYRLSNSHARMILDSLEVVDTNIFLRRQIEGWYDAACPLPWCMPGTEVPWVFDLRIGGMKYGEQDRVVNQLQRAGIAARHAFKPMLSQPEFSHLGSPCPNALRASREVIYLPIQPGVTTQERVQRSFDVIRSTLAELA